MSKSYLFTRRFLGMDSRVWITLILVCVSSLIIFAFTGNRNATINDEHCPKDSVLFNGKKVSLIAYCYRNRYSSFEFPSEGAVAVEWNFGDESEIVTGRIASHKFDQSGTYHVKATVNRTCKYDFLVEVVGNPNSLRKFERPVIEIFADPMRPVADVPVKFYCVTSIPSVNSYHWRILGSNAVKTEPVPNFVFSNEGNYTIELVINGDSSLITRAVVVVLASKAEDPFQPDMPGFPAGMPPATGPLVSPDPPAGKLPSNDPATTAGSNPGPVKTNSNSDTLNLPARAPEIDPASFQELLQNVVNEEGKELQDLYQFLDYKESTTVKVNDNAELQSLAAFCKKMRERKKKKRQIKSVSFKMDDKKSVQVINVKISEDESFWGRLNPFN